MTNAIADKIEQALGISSVALVNIQTQYNYDLRHREVQSQTRPSGIIQLCTNVLGVPSTVSHPG